jgi:NitT/TauT family transport system substrate-binding protein
LVSRKHIVVLLVLVVSLSFVGTACGGGTSSPEGGTETVTIGTLPWIGYGPWYIAQEKGFDKKNGVKIELKNFKTDADLNSAFASRRLDAANVATHTSIKFQDAGLDFTSVLVEDVSTTADAIVAPKSVGSIQGLAGKKVAYEEGTTSDLLLNYALSQNGLSRENIETVPIPAADVGNALIAGRVDVGVTYEPYLTKALSEDPNLKLLYTAGEKPGLVSDVFVVQSEMAEEQPELIENLLKAWDQAVQFYDENTAEGQQIIGENVGITNTDELETTFEGVELYSLDENRELLQGEFQDTMVSIKGTLEQQGELESDPDPLANLETQFVENLGSGR